MDYIVAKEKAIKYIGISKKTEYEVRNKLKSLGVDSLTISRVIDYLKETEYINDINYIRAYIKQNEKLLKYSIYELKQKLLQKGLKASIIDEEFDSNLDTSYEIDVIDKLVTGKLKNYEDLKKREYLYRRGFKLENFGEIYDE